LSIKEGEHLKTQLVLGNDVVLVHRIALEKSDEIHAYFQPYNGVIKAHLRLVTVDKDGSVKYTGKGIAVSPDLLNQLLQAIALLAVEREAQAV
jgi:hypothetical protein